MTEVKRLFDFPYYQLENYPQDGALVSKVNGSWIKTSTQEYIDKANAISRGLIKLGVQANDKVAIISMTNRTERNFTNRCSRCTYLPYYFRSRLRVRSEPQRISLLFCFLY